MARVWITKNRASWIICPDLPWEVRWQDPDEPMAYLHRGFPSWHDALDFVVDAYPVFEEWHA